MDESELTPQELDETLLPPKPLAERLPSDAELEADDPPGEEELHESEFLSAGDAAADPTVDDAEDDK